MASQRVQGAWGEMCVAALAAFGGGELRAFFSGGSRALYPQHSGASVGVQVAEDIEAGLIVMGSLGLGGMRTLIGSVSDSVIRHAHCPVLVVRPEQERAAHQLRS